MIDANTYRQNLLPKDLTNAELDIRISDALGRGEKLRLTKLAVKVPRKQLDEARRMLEKAKFEVGTVTPATSEELAADAEMAARVGYPAGQYVEDTLAFVLPALIEPQAEAETQAT